MPSTLVTALTALVWAAAFFLLFLIIWLWYCECRRWAAAAELPTLFALHSPICPAGDGKAIAQLRMHPGRLG